MPVRRSLFGHVAHCLTHYADFSGRAMRAEYWSFQLVYMVGLYVMAALPGRPDAVSAGGGGETIASPVQSGVFLLWLLAGFIPDLATTWRRLHDAGHSGGFFFLSFVPGVGGLILLVMTLLDSQRGPNRFGSPTKYP